MAVYSYIEGQVLELNWLLILVSIQLFFAVLVIGYGSELINLHRWLQRNNIVTFDLVIFNREKEVN